MKLYRARVGHIAEEWIEGPGDSPVLVKHVVPVNTVIAVDEGTDEIEPHADYWEPIRTSTVNQVLELLSGDRPSAEGGEG